MAHPIDGAIEALARKQHGAFSTQQVREHGGNHELVRRRVASGRWIRLDRAVFALPGNPATPLRQMKAAELAVPHAALSGLGAAVLHGLPGIRMGRLEVTTNRHGGWTPLSRVRHRHPVPTTIVESIRVTTAAQTIADIASRVTPHLLGDAVGEALRRRTTSFEELTDAWETARARRQPGAARLKTILLRHEPGAAIAASVLETRLYRVLDDPRLPPFVRQAPTPWAPDGPERVDASFPSMRWIVEGDGRAWHTRVNDFERDRRRDHLAQASGWSITRFTMEQIDRPGYVAETLVAAFAGRHRAA
jgi:very-short-patch-repair endonuclease